MKRNFKNLIVWEKSHKLVLEIYKITSQFPENEIFALISQLRRAAYSVPANIAEGCVKSQQGFINHLVIAQGSLEEVKYFLILSFDLKYIRQDQFKHLMDQCEELGGILYAFIRKSKEFNAAS